MTGAGTGTKTGGQRGLASRMVLTIRWRSSSKYLTTEELAEPKATSGATTGVTAGVEARVVAGAGVQRLLPLVGVPPASLSLPSKNGFWRGLQQAENRATGQDREL